MQLAGLVSVVPVAAASTRHVQAVAPEALRVRVLRQLRQAVQETDPAADEVDTSSADAVEAPAPDASCPDSVMAQVKGIMTRLTEIGGYDVEHPDALTQAKLRKEYRALEQQLDACLSSEDYAHELKREELAWEEKNAAANEQALRDVRRCLPVLVRSTSEAVLKSTKSPTGRPLPPAMARRFKRTTVLGLLRASPASTAQMHPSAIVHLNYIGLNLTERRALHAHLRQTAQLWEASPRNALTQQKIDWYSGLVYELKRAITSYDKHMERNGVPGSQTGTGDLYEEDLGWPEGEVYADAVSAVKCGLPVDETALHAST
ncbi:hypothetical protein PHYSODRAFT_300161 [Phytophthora sojae]|uniref:Uncharacterized protein n=1 Tax=Phytophthora sojae (strain P6497) TaxID=1094619 RepID=G4ZD98_PHYSP|nr:hypothetical protein PHYSODRAFT_300161 [Phytophthora sojae]EGZ16903.1 hypothetical protein PHYSODRAFT_300161 [Phytophthora sojae]|eukprot:XP_009525961.1 hypothetical protein PHYSODRAFT_300161 [Phytophthora sojae]